MISSAQTAQIEELVNKTVKYAEKNPAVVGVSAAAAIIAGVLVYRRPKMNRDGNDYDNQLTGSMRILNNADHTLKGEEFGSSINDYESMFSGARQSTGAITSEESVEQRKARYADMVNHFYNLVTDFYEWGWGQRYEMKIKNQFFVYLMLTRFSLYG